jgi:hypothetical protein
MGAPAKKRKEAAEADASPPAPAAKGELVRRLGAWWHGDDYVPGAPAEEGEASANAKAHAAQPPPAPPPASIPEPTAPPAAEPSAPPAAIAAAETAPESEARPARASAAQRRGEENSIDLRLKAVTALWGAERLSPGSAEMDAQLLDLVFDAADRPGDIGFIGADAALLNAARSRSDRKLQAAEWRTDCVEYLRAMAPAADVQASETDRPRGLGEGNLEGLLSIEAFAYADHKAGLASRAFRALSQTGRWVVLDTVRHTAKTPAKCFASAWAEPQLTTTNEIEDLLKLAGFAGVAHISMTADVMAAARAGYKQLGEVLDSAVKAGPSGREGAIFLQELTWEIQTWRARMRAFEGGALSVDLWIADKDPSRAARAREAAQAPSRPVEPGAGLFEPA